MGDCTWALHISSVSSSKEAVLGANPRTQCCEETAKWEGRILESTAKWMAGVQRRRECWWSQGWTEWDAKQGGGGERRGTEPTSAVRLVSTSLLL